MNHITDSISFSNFTTFPIISGMCLAAFGSELASCLRFRRLVAGRLVILLGFGSMMVACVWMSLHTCLLFTAVGWTAVSAVATLSLSKIFGWALRRAEAIWGGSKRD